MSTGRASAVVVAGHPYPRSAGVCAPIGATPAVLEPDRVDVAINGAPVCRGEVIGDPCAGVDLSGRSDHLSIAYVHGNSAYCT